MRNKRTDIDWSKHQVIENHSDNCKIWSLKVPNSMLYAVHFINAMGVMTVTGDLGNWVFCREWHPSAEGRTDDGYWCEKLRLSSTQKEKEFSSKETSEALEKYISEEIWENHGEEKPEGFSLAYHSYKIDDLEVSEEIKKELEWLFNCLDHVDECEERYMVYAHDEMPSHLDHESVIVEYKLHYQLQGVFDAFDEICNRMEHAK